VTQPARSVAGVILAAGEARRFGAQKLLAPFEGRPIVQHVIDAANAAGLADAVLVVGADADAILAGIALGRVRPVWNPDYATGQASSLQAGLRALGDLDAALVLLADVPGVTTALLEALLAKQRETGAPAVSSRWAGRRMPPVLLHRELWPAALALSGDVGMRDVLAGRKDVAEVEVTAALGALDDVDTRADHERLSTARPATRS
jgi:molybdenum cofactor cytidylyltransferase